MFKSRPSRTLGLLISIIVVSVTSPVNSDAQVSNDRDTVLTSAHDFLRSSYPELVGRDLLLDLSITQGIDSPWTQIYEMRLDVKPHDPRSEGMLNPPFDPKTGKQLPPPENAPLLQGSISFTREGRVHQFYVGDCALSHSKENDAIRRQVESHPEWSEAQALVELGKAGARFGPASKEELLQAIQLQKYERFLGHFTIKSVEFVGLTEPHAGNFASLSWSIRLDVESSGGSHSPYTLVFEPFGGKLTEVLHGLTGAVEEHPPGLRTGDASAKLVGPKKN